MNPKKELLWGLWVTLLRHKNDSNNALRESCSTPNIAVADRLLEYPKHCRIRSASGVLEVKTQQIGSRNNRNIAVTDRLLHYHKQDRNRSAPAVSQALA